MIIIGAGVALCGVALDFWLEWELGIRSAPWAPFDYLQYLSPYALLIGLPLAIAGASIWARSVISAKTLKTSGFVISGCAVLGFIITGINVHDWTMTMAFVYAAALVIGMIFLAFARRTNGKPTTEGTSTSE